MLVTFRTDVGSISMFGEVARPMLKMMGQTGDIPGAVVAKDLPAALERLKGAVAAAKAAAKPQGSAKDDDRGEAPPIGMAVRAAPLVELLERAVKRESDLVWGQ